MTENDDQRRLRSERGASMVEYALLVVLIAVAAFAAVQLFGGTLSDTYDTIASEVSSASG